MRSRLHSSLGHAACSPTLDTHLRNRADRQIELRFPVGLAKNSGLDFIVSITPIQWMSRSRSQQLPPRFATCSIGGVRPAYFYEPTSENCGRAYWQNRTWNANSGWATPLSTLSYFSGCLFAGGLPVGVIGVVVFAVWSSLSKSFSAAAASLSVSTLRAGKSSGTRRRATTLL